MNRQKREEATHGQAGQKDAKQAERAHQPSPEERERARGRAEHGDQSHHKPASERPSGQLPLPD